MSVPSVDGRKYWEGVEPGLRHPPGGPAAFGFWATTGLALAAIAFGLGVFTGLSYALYALVPRASLGPTVLPHVIELMNFVFLASVIAALVWIIRRSGWAARDYFAFVRPGRRDIYLVIACAAVMWGVWQALSYAVDWGKTDQAHLIDDYRKASSGGLSSIRWFAALVTAPLVEETFFRGFLYRGWSQSRLGVSGTILLTSVLFGLMHYQYGWYGRCEVAFFAILAGWLRWQTGSLVPPMMLHAAIGGSSMLYVAIATYWSA